MFEVKTETFSGPLGKLLELIESKKMDINQISLSEVTADFLKHIDLLKKQFEKVASEPDGETKMVVEEFMRILADFLSIAAQLILIKSRTLLPNLEIPEDEEGDFQNLELRLKLYQELKPTFVALKTFWLESDGSYSRNMLYYFNPVFYPPKNVSVDNLHKSINELIKSFGNLFLQKDEVERQLILLEDKINELSEKISSGISKFSDVVQQKTKEEIIVFFLALLHLLRERVLKVKQSKIFDEIEFLAQGKPPSMTDEPGNHAAGGEKEEIKQNENGQSK